MSFFPIIFYTIIILHFISWGLNMFKSIKLVISLLLSCIILFSIRPLNATRVDTLAQPQPVSALTWPYIDPSLHPTFAPIVLDGMLYGGYDFESQSFVSEVFLNDNDFKNMFCDTYEAYQYIDSTLYSNTLKGNLTVGSSLNPYPRPVTIIDPTHPFYLELIQNILLEQGLDAAPILSKGYYFDLEGDGTMELLILASNMDEACYRDRQVDYPTYSFILYRKIVEGTVKNILINPYFYKANTPITTINALDGIADLNQDNIFEVLLTTQNGSTFFTINELTLEGLNPLLTYYICGY